MPMITGTAYWAKIVGRPQPGYKKSELEWSMDVAVDDKNKAVLKELGLGKKIKHKDDIGSYIVFKRKAKKSDGSDAKPIAIVDRQKQPWGNALIGNGSKVNVKFVVNETQYEGNTHLKPGILAVQVVDLVEYEGKGEEFPDFDEDGNESWD